jgi:hypothetical protein
MLALNHAQTVNSKLMALPKVQQWIIQARQKGYFKSV